MRHPSVVVRYHAKPRMRTLALQDADGGMGVGTDDGDDQQQHAFNEADSHR